MIFFMILGGLVILIGWWIPGALILAGVALWGRYDNDNGRSLSVLPEALMFYTAILGIILGAVL